MEITRKQVEEIFEDLGYKSVKKWKYKFLKNKLQELPHQVKDISKMDEKLQPLVSSILRKMESGKTITILKEETATPGEETPAKTEAVKEKKDKKVEKEKSPKEKKESILTKSNKVGRVEAATQVLSSLKGKITLEEAASLADTIHTESGGNTNLVEALGNVRKVVRTLKGMGVITVDGTTICRVK
jgi:hypothetical protein